MMLCFSRLRYGAKALEQNYTLLKSHLPEARLHKVI